MKMENLFGLGKMPLPGDRQGTLGATAEGDSIRDSGDEMLNRRAFVDKTATADPTPHSFIRSDIVGDGSCLFRSVSLHLYNHQNHHQKLREEALKYLRQNWLELHKFALIEDDDMKDFNNYYSYMKKVTTYGTSLEILALSETQNSNFYVFSKQRPTRGKTITFKDNPLIINNKEHANTIYLLLTGNPMSGHFELLSPHNNEDTTNNGVSGVKRSERDCRGKRLLNQNKVDGDRKVMSGADAGHDSARDVGDRVLRRRTPVIQQASTLQTQTPRSPTPTKAPPTRGAAREQQPALTQGGLPRRRMAWTCAMNEAILRIYFRVTALEQNKTGYRQRLHQDFCKEYPDLQVTEQRVADQYRVILRNRLVPETRLNTIKVDIQRELENQNIGQTKFDNNNEIHEVPIETEPILVENSADPIQNNEENQELYVSLLASMKEKFNEYDGTDSLSRPMLPRLNLSKKLAIVLELLNKRILPDYIANTRSLEDLHTIIYCAAVVAVEAVGAKIRHNNRHSRTERGTPNWERRLNNKIENLRREIGQITQYINGTTSVRLQRKVETILQRTRIHSQWEATNKTPQQCLDTLKQKLSVFSSRLRRYKTSNKRKQDNKLFKKAEKVFYRNLVSNENELNICPSKEEVDKFWRGQLSTPAQYNAHAAWIIKELEAQQDYEEMPNVLFTTEEVSNLIKQTHNWKTPGPDGVQNFWLKRLYSAHKRLALFINEIIADPRKMPEFLTQGITSLLAKDMNNTIDPSKYRPITCLPTLYKLITSCIAQRIYAHCEENNIIAVQQKGCGRNSRGCKEQLIIDSIITGQAYKKNRNLYMAYIDYKKAFDSVSHEWLIRILDIYKVNPAIVNFLKHAMKTWRTQISLSSQVDAIATNIVPIKCGIFQGDSLSPLWFCLALNPLSSKLNSTKYGFALKNGNVETARVSHLLYMDDLKLMAATKNQLNKMLNIVEEFSGDIGMQFGLDKCRTIGIVRGQIKEDSIYTIKDGQDIEAMSIGDTYKYLGMKQARRIDHKTMKEELKAEFQKRVRQLLRTSLDSKNLFQALNSYACSALSYSFGIVKWSITDIKSLERKVRTQMTRAHKHHPKSAVERISLPRHMGGRGLIDLTKLLDQQIKNLRQYFYQQAENSMFYTALCQADNSTPLMLQETNTQSQHLTNAEKAQVWKEKSLHGRHPNEADQEQVDKLASNYWLTSGRIFPETEGFLIAIQDQVIPTKNYLRYIVKDTTVRDDRCRYGCQTTETIQHITGGCQTFAATEYKKRHDSVAKILHQELSENLKLQPKEGIPYYSYAPEPVLENEIYKLYWDRTVLTDLKSSHNRPDIILVNKRSRCTTLIDVAIPNNNNITAKHAEKIAKYRDLQEHIRRQWHMETVRTIPIVLSTTGIIPKRLLQNIRHLGLTEQLYRPMQKAVLLGTARTVRKFMGIAEPSQKNHSRPENMERAPTELRSF